jgi:hypothetical protein
MYDHSKRNVVELILAVVFATVLISSVQPWEWVTNLWWLSYSEGRLEMATMLVACGWVLRSSLRLRPY